MLKSQSILLGMHEINRKLIALDEREAKGAVEEGDAELRAALLNEWTEKSVAHDEAIKVEEIRSDDRLNVPPPDSKDADPEDKEFNAIYHEARLVRWLDFLAQDKQLDGAEKELRDALFPEGVARGSIDTAVPLHMFLPFEEGIEVRADVATTQAQGSAHRVTHPIMERIFARTDAAYMGARFESVNAGAQQYPYLEQGGTLIYADEGENIDAEPGSIRIEAIQPAEAGLSYVIGMTSALQFPTGELESSLRNDASMAIGEGTDITAFEGRAARAAAAANPAAPAHGAFTGPIVGLYGSLTAAANAAAVVTARDVMQVFASRVDGKYANVWSEVRQMVHPKVYEIAIFKAFGGDAGERLLADMVSEANFRASNRLPAPDGNDRTQGISYAPMRDRGEWKIPTWQDVQVVVDDITRANRRQRKITMFLAHNVIVLRNDPWKRHGYKTA